MIKNSFLLFYFSICSVFAQNNHNITNRIAEAEMKSASKLMNLQVNLNTANYDLTYSYSGLTPEKITHKGLLNPHNSRIAVVFMRKADIPAQFNAWPVIDGDDTDVRHIEPKNVVVALYAKGKAKRDNSGVVQSKGVHYA